MLKRARKLVKWIKGNLKWLLAALAVLGIVVGGWVERGNYKAKMQAQVDAHKATIVERETEIKELQSRKVEKVTETVTVEVYDVNTGKLLKKTTMELAKVKEENRKLLASRGRVPKIPLPGQQEAGLYPLGGFLIGDVEGDLGAGIQWRAIPRLSLPLVPDLSLAVGIGCHRTLLGLVLVDFHRK